MRGWKRHIALAVGAAIFLGVMYSLGPPAVWRSLKGADFLLLGLSVVPLIVSSCIRIYKWALMRDRVGSGIGTMELCGIYFSSKFWGMFSPMRSGEVAPALLREDGRGGVLSIILYDRVLETAQSLIVFGALFFLLYGVFFNVQVGYALAGVVLVLLAFTAALVDRRVGGRVFSLADAALALPGGWRPAARLRGALQGLKGEMDEFYKATRSYFTPGFTLLNLSLTFLCWALDMLCFVILFKAVGIGTGLLITITSVMVYSLASALAPVPGGLGVSDLSFALVLGHFGWKGEAGGFIILSRILVTVYIFLGYAAFSAARPRGEGGR